MQKKTIERPSLDTIQAALSFIPPNERDLWLKIGMGIKQEFGEAGFDVFDSWSRSAENYNQDAAKSSWKSFKTGGKIGIGTVLYEAKQRGFNIKESLPAAPVSAEQAALLAQERADRLAADQAEIERKQAAAASMAAKAWDSASNTGQSPIYKRKVLHHMGYVLRHIAPAMYCLFPCMMPAVSFAIYSVCLRTVTNVFIQVAVYQLAFMGLVMLARVALC